MLFVVSMLAMKDGAVDNYHSAAFVEAGSKDEAMGLAYRLASHSYKLSEGYRISIHVSEQKLDAAAVDRLTKKGN